MPPLEFQSSRQSLYAAQGVPKTPIKQNPVPSSPILSILGEVESSFLKITILVVDWNFEVLDASVSEDMGINLDT